MKHVLVAVDGSEQSLRAARLALQVAGDAKVTLVHVSVPPLMTSDEPFDQLPLLLQAQRSSATRMLADLQTALGGSTLDTLIRNGSPAEEISAAADELNADLVVAGSKGRGAVARVLLGSVADRLVHICRQPVLVSR